MLRSPRPANSASAVGEREPAELEVVGNTLNVRDAGHWLLWSRPFDVPLEDFIPTAPGAVEHLRRLTAIGDFRQTGHKDVILARNTPRDPRLYYFNHAGHVEFTHRIGRDVAFGGLRCTAVRFSRLFADIDGAEPGVFWIAGHELTGNFPAVLQQIDGSGRVRSEYWSAGFVGAMALVTVNGRRLTLVGSAANETGGAALAVFDGAANGSSPAADPAYRCSGCPEGAPLHYLVFPRSRLQAELGHNSQVVGISNAAGRTIRIRVVQAGNPGIPGDIGSAYYTLDSAFRIVDGELSSDVEPLQRKSEAEHMVTPATRPRGKADLFPVLRWNGRGYDRIAGPETR